MESNVPTLLHTSPYCRSFLLGSYKPNVQIIPSPTNRVFAGVKLSIPKLDFEGNRRVFAVKSMSKAEVYDSSSVEVKRTEDVEEIVNPVYAPTPSDREHRTPHSGYHFDGTTRKFFEGWYFKVSIPERRQNFCFMYSVENPAFKKQLNTLEQVLQYGQRFTGVGAQILGADDEYICQYSRESQNFWGSRHELMLGNSFTLQKGKRPPNKEVPPQVFNQSVLEGFQVTPLWNQGFIRDDGRTSYAKTVKTARWEYSTRPIYGWGDVGLKQKSTAGWLAAFPVFEPHWQICMAGGLSTGWIEWGDERYEFQNAPSYSEKNWGGGFPRKWFWVQCNVFKGTSGEVALTCGGGLRQLPGLNETYENAALIGVHFEGIFYEFVPWNGAVEWEVAQWGYWHVTAYNKTHKVELEATTKDPGTTLRAPTTEAGLAPACRDTCTADLTLKIWEKRFDGNKGKLILDVTSNMAAVEVGGGPWFNTWKGKTYTPEIINRALNLPVDVGGILSSVPLLKPPGLCGCQNTSTWVLDDCHEWQFQSTMNKEPRDEVQQKRINSCAFWGINMLKTFSGHFPMDKSFRNTVIMLEMIGKTNEIRNKIKNNS